MPTDAWGQSTNQGFQALHREVGGKVLSSIPIPLDAKDFVPYSSEIPGELLEVLLPAFIGSLSVAFYTQAKNMGLDKKMKKIDLVGQHRIDCTRRHPGRRRRRLLLREFPAHAQGQGR